MTDSFAVWNLILPNDKLNSPYCTFYHQTCTGFFWHILRKTKALAHVLWLQPLAISPDSTSWPGVKNWRYTIKLHTACTCVWFHYLPQPIPLKVSSLWFLPLHTLPYPCLFTTIFQFVLEAASSWLETHIFKNNLF